MKRVPRARRTTPNYRSHSSTPRDHDPPEPGTLPPATRPARWLACPPRPATRAEAGAGGCRKLGARREKSSAYLKKKKIKNHRSGLDATRSHCKTRGSPLPARARPRRPHYHTPKRATAHTHLGGSASVRRMRPPAEAPDQNPSTSLPFPVSLPPLRAPTG